MNGREYRITIEYEGNKVIQNSGGGTFAVGAREAWYPSVNAFSDRATYDLTFKTPKQYTLVAVGKLVKEWREGDFAASQWTSDVPLAVAGFNYGDFKKKMKSDKDAKYDIEGYSTTEPPSYLRNSRFLLTPSAMAENAITDAQNSIRIFQRWFGDAPYGRIAITQQPEFNFGQSWPTLVYLPVSAFLDSTQRWGLIGIQNMSRFSDFIEEVTPHEVAHQWWGHMVGWATYHDQWLSEGFADFSASLFLQITEKKPDKFLKYWEHGREVIVEKNRFGQRANDAGPLWMGVRLNTFKNANAYQRIIYPKGGYVLHMLRYLMQDDKTGDQDFIAMMHDFVTTYLHKNASTEDFIAIADKHMKPDMDLAGNHSMGWFFGPWVYGTELPRYRLEYSLTPESGGQVLMKGRLTQSDVSKNFKMAVPVYGDFDGRIVRMLRVPVMGSGPSPEFKIRLPRKPKRVLLNAMYDVLAAESVAVEI